MHALRHSHRYSPSSLPLAICAAILCVPVHGVAADLGVTVKKVTIVDTIAKNGKSKLVVKSKDATVTAGAAGDPAQLTGLARIFYTDTPANASSFDLPFPR